MDLTGKRILVTGASSGIGRDTAILLSRLGATLAITGRDETRLNKALESLEGSGHIASVFDFSQEGVVPWFQGIAAGGPFHGFVHAAGVQATIPVKSLSESKIDALMRTNVSSALMLSKAFCHRTAHVKPASIVFLSSVMSVVGKPAISLYSASKGALAAMTKSLALELARDKIRVNCVAPGFVPTEMWDDLRGSLSAEQFDAIVGMHPLGAGTTLDVANSIAFLLSDASRWITGTNLMVDGGYTAI
jgi:NAD(P)-dependent dehydrogenase (short-subunit alcohol dehydrogenase family)